MMVSGQSYSPPAPAARWPRPQKTLTVNSGGYQARSECSLEMIAQMLPSTDRTAPPYAYGYKDTTQIRESQFGTSTTLPDQGAQDYDSQPPSVRAIEDILDRFLIALNSQDFSLETWNKICPNLRIAWGVLNWNEKERDLPLAEWLQAMHIFAQRAPDYQFEIWNRTTVVDEEKGTAESLMNVESVGVYPGLLRTAVSGFSFVRSEDGSWDARRHGAFPGSGMS